jgi:predicted metalloprotease
MLTDEARVAATYQAAFTVGTPPQPISPAQAALFASIVADAVEQSQILDGGDFALFSFNAFAVSDPSGVIPDKIVMGDGILASYEALGFGDVAPEAVYAHEFAHHIQFENGYQTEPIPGSTPPITQAERTRYLELMSDATAAYYLTHKRGATMNKHRVAEFLQAFFEIGDCGFTSPGHHGTPAQRMRAAEFGFSVADQAQKQGHILSSEAFHELFVAEFPDLVAP